MSHEEDVAGKAKHNTEMMIRTWGTGRICRPGRGTCCPNKWRGKGGEGAPRPCRLPWRGRTRPSRHNSLLPFIHSTRNLYWGMVVSCLEGCSLFACSCSFLQPTRFQKSLLSLYTPSEFPRVREIPADSFSGSFPLLFSRLHVPFVDLDVETYFQHCHLSLSLSIFCFF